MKRILFVCRDGRFRAPFAQLCLQTFRPDLDVRSAGIRCPFPGNPMALPSRDAATALGMDATQIITTQLGVEDVAWSQRLIYMTDSDRRRLLDRYGSDIKVRAKLYSLGHWAEAATIKDPSCIVASRSRRAIYQQIHTACSRLAGEIGR